MTILGPWNVKKGAKTGLTVLMVSTTGEQYGYFVLDENPEPKPANFPTELAPSGELIGENCEPALCSVLFMGGAGESLRSGATRNPVKLTRSVQSASTRVTCGGAPVYVWPGGGITVMVDVTRMPDNSFGYVPTPTVVAPIEFNVSRDDYRTLGGHDDAVRSVEDILARGGEYGASVRAVTPPQGNSENGNG